MENWIQEFRPGPALSPYVTHFWTGEFNLSALESFQQQVAPNGLVELVIHLTDRHCMLPTATGWARTPVYTLIGLQSRSYDVRFTSTVKVFGIRFKPERFRHIFGVPAAEFSDLHLDIGHLAGRRFNVFQERLLKAVDILDMVSVAEAWLLDSLKRHGFGPDYLDVAADLIRQTRGLITLEDLTRKVFISARQLERAFRQGMGVTPKHYMRIARLGEAFRQIQTGRPVDMTRISHACGYFDQSHFIREFRAFVGEKPGYFTKNREQYIVNVAKD